MRLLISPREVSRVCGAVVLILGMLVFPLLSASADILAPDDLSDTPLLEWSGSDEDLVALDETGVDLDSAIDSVILTAVALTSYAPVPKWKPKKVYSIREITFRDLFDEEDLTVKVTIGSDPEVSLSVPKGGANTLTLNPAKPSDSTIKIVIESANNYQLVATYNSTLSKPADGKVVYDIDQELLISR